MFFFRVPRPPRRPKFRATSQRKVFDLVKDPTPYASENVGSLNAVILPVKDPSKIDIPSITAHSETSLMSFDMDNFCTKFQELSLKWFKCEELLVKGSSHTNPSSAAFGLNTDPPTEVWTSLFKLFSTLDLIRSRLRSPLYTTSVYRSPKYNKSIGGAQRSYHMRGLAADVYSKKISANILHKHVTSFREQGLFQGGIGKYDTFVHIDIRGRNIDW